MQFSRETLARRATVSARHATPPIAGKTGGATVNNGDLR
jgi:hypothetical protein